MQQHTPSHSTALRAQRAVRHSRLHPSPLVSFRVGLDGVHGPERAPGPGDSPGARGESAGELDLVPADCLPVCLRASIADTAPGVSQEFAGALAPLRREMRACAWALAALACSAVVRPAAGGKITTSRPFLIDSTVADMQWVNSSLKDAMPNAKTVFVRSTLGSIYRSTDDGMNWVSQRDKVRPFASCRARAARLPRTRLAAAERSACPATQLRRAGQQA